MKLVEFFNWNKASALAGAFLILLSGCTSIGTHIPAIQMESPETNGQWLSALTRASFSWCMAIALQILFYYMAVFFLRIAKWVDAFITSDRTTAFHMVYY